MAGFWMKVTLLSLILSTLVLDHCCLVTGAGANEWSLGPADEYVTAFINLTFMEAKKLHTEKSEVGRFGSGKLGSANGVVVHVYSQNRTDVHFGCEYPYGNHLPTTEPWIALVRKGNCSFDKKLENAFRSNASALVVYARDEKEPLEKMIFKSCNFCDIPTVFTYKWKGEEIAKKVDNGINIFMYITVGETCSRPYSGINRTSVLFVSISFIVLMIISLAWLVFYYVQRFRYLHAKDRLAQRLCNAAKKALAKIPTRNIKPSDREMLGEGECCAVCIELYRSGDTLRTLPCKHEFHKGCVDPWLLEHRTCPMCKMDILKYYGFIFSGSQESILHLDIEDGVLNSSEETDSPSHEPHLHHTHPHHHPTPQGEEPTHSASLASFPPQPNTGATRKSSLISLTVVAAPRGTFITTTSECTDCHESNSKNAIGSPTDELMRSNSKSSLQNCDHKIKCCVKVEESPKTKSPNKNDGEDSIQELSPISSSASHTTSGQNMEEADSSGAQEPEDVGGANSPKSIDSQRRPPITP